MARSRRRPSSTVGSSRPRSSQSLSLQAYLLKSAGLRRLSMRYLTAHTFIKWYQSCNPLTPYHHLAFNLASCHAKRLPWMMRLKLLLVGLIASAMDRFPPVRASPRVHGPLSNDILIATRRSHVGLGNRFPLIYASLQARTT